MTELRTIALRPWLAAVLVLVLSIAGVVAHICHADDTGSPGPNSPGHPDCCDTCALCAPVTLPVALDLKAPARVIHYVAHTAALGWAPALVRPRTPRLAQGPPFA